MTRCKGLYIMEMLRSKPVLAGLWKCQSSNITACYLSFHCQYEFWTRSNDYLQQFYIVSLGLFKEQDCSKNSPRLRKTIDRRQLKAVRSIAGCRWRQSVTVTQKSRESRTGCVSFTVMTLAAWMFSPLLPMCLNTRHISQKLSVLWSDITAAFTTSARCPRGDSDGMLFAWQLGARIRRRCVTSNRDVGYLASISTQGYLDGSSSAGRTCFLLPPSATSHYRRLWQQHNVRRC